MTMINTYQYTAEQIKDQILEENRVLTRKLAEAQQSFELLKMVHFDKSINLEVLNDIIIGCTGCLYSMMFYVDMVISNLDPNNKIYNQIIEKKEELTSYDTLFVSDDILSDFTVVVYPVSVSQMISDKQAIKNIILLYPSRFITPEVLDFVKSFMLVNDVLINIVISREEMRRLIETDPLTKLLNRSLWNSNLEVMKSERSPFFILFIDVDNFKMINDTHGHQKGDDILQSTADWLKKSFRDVDKIFRLGGDEFAATGRVNSEYLEGFVQKLYSLNESYTKDILSKQELNATISIGALICEKVQNIESLYSRVDDLLYESKQKGRNTISIISDFENDVI